ncbi:hypothetical protein EDC19_0417 [Natranaerovirga hydrolytica]|uniref:Uncharacterized protein n=1 Tax=Natranaerovirga hydrolytica TaxID=680378 RepID=A0A4V2Q1K7_9FIRM|nr:hypothetical protein [Natranaerovirga hydrolytica]TCK98011.1 hypothetical protein EDC19_0417 [Natranaerovirga hydrolytica]
MNKINLFRNTKGFTSFILLITLLTLTFSASIYGNTQTTTSISSQNEGNAESKSHKDNNNLIANVGTLSFDGPTVFTEQEIALEEKVATNGGTLIARVGTLTFEEPTVGSNRVNNISPMAVKPPTSEAPNYPYSWNWSNTVNFTYTNYYFKEGDFDAEAESPFTAEFYYKDGTYGGAIKADNINGKYQVRATTQFMGYYYVVLINDSNSPAKNATFTAYANPYTY